MESILDKLARKMGQREEVSWESRTTLPTEAEGGWREWRWWAHRLYRVICFGAGLVLLELSLLKLSLSTAKAASLFVLLNVAAAIPTVTFPKARRISFHFIITYANLLLFGPGVAALGSGVGAFSHHLLLRKKPLSAAMFQMGRFILAVMGAGFIFAALGGRWGVVNLSWASVVLSVMAYLAIGLALEAVPFLWSRKISPLGFVRTFLWEPLAYVIFVPTSISIFYIYYPYGSDGVLLFLIPVATFVLALELYARSTIARRNLATVQEISKRFSTILDPDQLSREALELTGGVIDFVSGVLWFKNPQTGNLEVLHAISPAGANRPVPVKPSPVVMAVAQTGRPSKSMPLSSRKGEILNESAHISELAVPLSSRGEVLGVLSLDTAARGGYTSRERLLLETLAGNWAIALQNAKLYKQREREAIRDSLTQVYNRRYLQEKLTQEEARAKRYRRIFSLIIMDIDHFKIFNDTFGHPAGDHLLIALAKILVSSVREVDFVARYGGEEFAVVLPECDKENAALVAERIRKKVEDFPNPHRERYNLTISVGVSSFPEDGDKKEEILDRADKALYRAKREGRNKVCL